MTAPETLGLRPDSKAAASACRHNIGALIVRIGFWGPLYYNHKKTSIGDYLGPYIGETMALRVVHT